jgi:3-hydroxyacyl-[acyl-carrier-protein] dehydratase
MDIDFGPTASWNLGLAVIVIATLGWLGWRDMQLHLFDPQQGQVLGRPMWLVEILVVLSATTVIVLAFDAMGQVPDENNIYYFVGIDSARFKRPVEPGDQLILEASIDRVRGGIWKFKGVARVGEEVACEAELMCTMRYVGPEKQA